MSERRGRVAIIGAGPAGLMAAEAAAAAGALVTVYDRMPSPGRKFLLAGRGGLNLTHSEATTALLARYGAAASHLAPAIAAFDADALRAWCEGLGIETFIGTSGRVFPKTLKTSLLLRAWLRRLDADGVTFAPRHRWLGFSDDGGLAFSTPGGTQTMTTDAVVLALGGASWPQLGSDGTWVGALGARGVDIAPLRPANCGFTVAWSEQFRDRFEGQPLQNIALAFDGRRARGDAVVTRAGLEGGAVYALAGAVREAIEADGTALVRIALRPDLSHEAILAKLAKRQAKQSFATMARKTLGLAPVAIGLLREADGAGAEGHPGTMAPDALARLVNDLPIRLHAPMPIARAISTAGGVAFRCVGPDWMLDTRPGVFVAGEMLDWEAPTGGYLLQACFATGRAAGNKAAAWALSQIAASAGRAAAINEKGEGWTRTL